jgi:Mrp family chromosome partitioning ATPase
MHAVDSVPALAGQLLVRPPDIGGFRTLITGETEGIDPDAAGVDLAKALADARADVMLVDWSPDGHGVAEMIGAQTHPGLAELLQGKARFEDVVARVPGSAAHLIPAGTAALRAEEMLDPDQINLALDALDTAYDHIVVVGSNQARSV